MEISKVKNYTEYLEYNCTMASFTNKNLILKFNFRNPLIYHSGIGVEDLVQITILKPELFIVKGKIGEKYFISNQSL